MPIPSPLSHPKLETLEHMWTNFDFCKQQFPQMNQTKQSGKQFVEQGYLSHVILWVDEDFVDKFLSKPNIPSNLWYWNTKKYQANLLKYDYPPSNQVSLPFLSTKICQYY